MKHQYLNSCGISYSIESIHGDGDEPLGHIFCYKETEGPIKKVSCYSRRDALTLVDAWSGHPKPNGGMYEYTLVDEPTPPAVKPPEREAYVVPKSGITHFRDIRLGGAFMGVSEMSGKKGTKARHFVKIPEMALECNGHHFIVNALELMPEEDEYTCPTKKADYFLPDALTWVEKKAEEDDVEQLLSDMSLRNLYAHCWG
jgi:hypothetical protein